MPVLDLESMDVLIAETYKMHGKVTLKCPQLNALCPDLNAVTKLRVYNHTSGSEQSVNVCCKISWHGCQRNIKDILQNM